MKKITIICLLIGLFLPFSQIGASDQGFPVNATNDSYNQDQFSVSGKYIVYSNKSGEKYELYLYDRTTGSKELLATQYGVAFEPAIDGQNLVWVETSYGKNVIWYNLETKVKNKIAKPNSYSHDIHPRVKGNLITFMRWNFLDNVSSIMYYQIAQDKLDGLIITRNTHQTNQNNDNDRIVWQDDSSKLNEIYTYDLATKKTKILIQNGLNHYFPTLSAQHVAWDSNNAIYVFNLLDNSLQVVGSNNYANFNSDLDGQNVVYQSYRGGNYDIYLYNLQTRSEVQITNSPADDEVPQLDGQVVTWKRKTVDGSYDIYYQNITSGTEKLYSQLTFKTLSANRVEISWPLTNTDQYVMGVMYRATKANEQGQVVAERIIGNSYIDSYLDLKQTYYYTLHLIDSSGRESENSNRYAYRPGFKKLVKLVNSPSVYLIDGQEYHVISTREMFNYYKFKDQDVQTIDQSELDQYVYRGTLLFPSGTLLKTSEDPAVYLVYNNVMRPFESAEVFLRTGYAWNLIKNVPRESFSSYQKGEKLTLKEFVHPDGALIRYSNQPTVYLMEGGRRRAITSEKTFQKFGFKWSDVIFVPTYWQYPDGLVL
ncbi:MAG: hypothetical protein COX77_04745 [Candidatus Komeilibacteria bacterium CG_4_10_14_0_2_um_filter_37_10]|uniref:Fibronectin type-III domain-containing protein n=1 Tax=Candidatus Komeilibacteria bacterium CG_4_10_14_0_2_um_filter_37_10 TaxID=1974470 RepID=A0A2M7VDL1_9BACT|nr:MAG: hypothetical protein COX77_04745 [Candidatus Komeilibacteria bacterium CG_4_10_14_0_2_um_filter_37_10]